GALGVALGGDARYHGHIKHKPTLGLAIKPVVPATLSEALQMKTGINIIVLSLLTAGILLS
ncbi:MAG: cobalamin biosynthesis protein CobD, partial [Methylobacter sp.]|nr:cobalamin biosynthesis protein CobD [Methylobacter sp.]